ncbi:MAG: cyclic nucleotide-binding domain-containing protein [Bacteroidota bacterium]
MKKQLKDAKVTVRGPGQAEIEALVGVITSITPMKASDLDLFYPIIKKKEIKKRDFLFKKGEVCKNMHFVTAGYFRMFYNDRSDKEINYKFIDKNKFRDRLSELPDPEAVPHTYCQAMRDSELLVWSYEDVHRTYAASPAWNNFGRLVAENVFLQLNERIEIFQFLTPEQR